MQLLDDVKRVSDELLEATGDYYVDRNIAARGITFMAFVCIVIGDGLEEQIFAHKNRPRANEVSGKHPTTE